MPLCVRENIARNLALRTKVHMTEVNKSLMCTPPPPRPLVRVLVFWLCRHWGNRMMKGVFYSDVNFHKSKLWGHLLWKFHNVRIINIINYFC